MSAMDGLSKKLRLLKRKVKIWTHEKTLAMKEKILLIEEEIQNLLGSSDSGLLSTLENLRLMALKEELKLLLDHELRSSKLQSRMTWTSLGMPILNFSTRLHQPTRIKMPFGAFKMIRGI